MKKSLKVGLLPKILIAIVLGIVCSTFFPEFLTRIFVTINGINYYWGAIRVTSMSSPMVAGTLALWLEANPNLTPEDVREIFSETAIRDEWTSSQPNNTWGYGKKL